MRRRGFTLVELMVVVTVIVILMSIAFRLAGLGDEQSKRALTIRRLQGVKNALSGYMAAFGSYPPVKLHANRNIYIKTTDGHQDEDGAEESGVKWRNVSAALLAQPVAAAYPYSGTGGEGNNVRKVSEQLKERHNSSTRENKEFAKREALGYGFSALTSPAAQLGGRADELDFNKAPIFMFGLMSYLLPRYLFMTKGDDELYGLKQWTYNNDVQKRCYGNGRETYTWRQILDDIRSGNDGLVAMLPSQAVCARWMPNLEGIVFQGDVFFGVNTGTGVTTFHGKNPYIRIYCPTHNKSQQYVLDEMTVQDGWSRDLYYYSPQPYQSYKLWSAGPNGKTFAPWVSLAELYKKDAAGAKTAARWMADDIE